MFDVNIYCCRSIFSSVLQTYSSLYFITRKLELSKIRRWETVSARSTEKQRDMVEELLQALSRHGCGLTLNFMQSHVLEVAVEERTLPA